MFISALIYGLVNSSILMILALGLSLTLGVSGIPHLAIGGLYVNPNDKALWSVWEV